MDKSVFSILDIDDICDISREQNDGKIILIGNEIEEGNKTDNESIENMGVEI